MLEQKHGEIGRDLEGQQQRLGDTLERALEAGADCAPVLQQLAAVRGAVNGLMSEVLESHLRESFAHPASSPAQRADGIDAAIALVRSYLK